jgi:Toprim domain
MGGLLGHAVRVGAADNVLAVVESIQTMLSLRCALTAMPMAAALSANHLAALLLPPALRRLYIARDADAAGDMGARGIDQTRQSGGH